MYRMLSLISMLAVLFLTLASAQNSFEEHILCSDSLNDVLMSVCREFNGHMVKRGMMASEFDAIDPIQYVEAKESHPLFRGRFRGGEGVANSLTTIRRLTRQGIVDRCCKVPCGFEILSEYCSEPRI